MEYPKPLEDLIVQFMNYPGVGRKTAERYAMHTLSKISDENLNEFASILANIKSRIFRCSICGHLTDVDPCHICSDHHRDSAVIMVVESSKDVFSFERSKTYKGKYHVLHGALSPINGVGPEELNLESLWTRLHDDTVKEIILATSSTQEGEATAMYIQRVLRNMDVVVSRIGYGVPVGANLEYADELTLAKAVENRKSY
ncbi:MAG: recombination protein RecR [Bacilli bacterium]|nr:recombination protein RecR [Bacilli bacterium]MBN2696542.1 recombination protein RecR [Bacilli bacterium]